VIAGDDMKKINGFTLFELLVVIGIIGILAMVSMPSVSLLIKQHRLTTNINHLQSVYKFARSESAKRDRVIQLDEVDGNWLVKLNDETLVSFIPTHSSISVTGLADKTIQATGETTSGNYLVTDGDSATTDFRLCIYVSGQSYVTTGACA